MPPETDPRKWLAELAQTATSLRYPSEEADPDVHAAQCAYANATAILAWAIGIVPPQDTPSP